MTDYTLFVPRRVSLININSNSKGKDDTRLGVKDRAEHKKLFFWREKVSGVLYLFFPDVPDIRNWKGIPDHSDFRRNMDGIEREERVRFQRLDPLCNHGSSTNP